MKHILKKWYRSIGFTLAGALVGILYYYTIGCKNGTCSITSNPINTMIYMGIMGWLLSGVFEKKEEIKIENREKALKEKES